MNSISIRTEREHHAREIVEILSEINANGWYLCRLSHGHPCQPRWRAIIRNTKLIEIGKGEGQTIEDALLDAWSKTPKPLNP